MKTILNIGAAAVLLTVLFPGESHTTLEAQPISSARQQAQGTPRPTSDPDSGDSFYYFTLGHLQEQQFEASGDSDQATQSIDSYKKALALRPGSIL